MNTRKILLTYPSFIIACLLVGAVFITAKTYLQLGIAILSYPVLIFFAYKIFRGKPKSSHLKEQATVTVQPLVKPKASIEGAKAESFVVTDINKRAFLKLVGATGISFFLISIFGRSIQSLLFGQNFAQTQNLIGNTQVDKAGTVPATPTDGYKISEVEDGTVSYYGFINKGGNWFIMKGDTNTGAFRYTRGASNFSDNWKNRKGLKYDYFDKVFS